MQFLGSIAASRLLYPSGSLRLSVSQPAGLLGSVTAHKLARIYYAMPKTRTPYDESRITGSPEKVALKKRQILEKQAAKLGFALTPLPT